MRRKKIFADLKTLWFENFPESPEENAFYEQTLYNGWYSETQSLSEEETKLLCLIHDKILEVDDNQVEVFKDKLHENYRDVIEKTFTMYAANDANQLQFLKGLFTPTYESDDDDDFDEDDESDEIDYDAEVIYFQFLSIERHNGRFTKRLFPIVEQAEILKDICSVLIIPNDFDKVDMELLRHWENGTMTLDHTYSNFHVYFDAQYDVKKKIVAHIKNNALSDEQINALFSIIRRTFVRDYSFEEDTFDDDMGIWKPFFALLPMSIRNEVLGTLE